MQKYYIKTKRVKTAVMTMSAFLLFVVSLNFFFPPASSPDGASATVTGGTITGSPTININILDGRKDATMKLEIDNNNGTFAQSKDLEEAAFSVYTDSYTGYKLTIEGENNENANKLINSVDDQKSFASIEGEISEETFRSSSDYNGKWGIKPSKYYKNNVSSTNNNFLPSPTASNPLIMDVTGSANQEDHPNEYTIGIGARANYSTASGIYQNTYNIAAVANAVGYEITYNGSVNGVTHLPDPNPQGDNTSSNVVQLSSDIPRRNNYTFLRWCLAQPEDNGTVCPEGTATFEPGADFDLAQYSIANKAVLYAVWSPNIAIKINHEEQIDEVSLNGEVCNLSTEGYNSSIGCTVKGLENGKEYDLVATVNTGYHLTNWTMSNSNGTIEDSHNASTKFTPNSGNTTITPSAAIDEYTIVLENTNATTTGFTSAVATYYSSDIALKPVNGNNPQRTAYTIDGFSTDYNNANGAQVEGSTDPLTNSYTFIGWYDNETNGNMIITPKDGETPSMLMPDTAYTDAFRKWKVNYGTTLYAHWGDLTSVTLPTISKTGHTCGWASSDSATGFEYASGDTIAPDANETLYGICIINTYDVTVNLGEGISSVTFTEDIPGGETKNVVGGKVNLTHGMRYEVSAQTSEGYRFRKWTLNDASYGELSSTSNNPTLFTPNGNSGSAVITAAGVLINSNAMQNMEYYDCTEEPQTFIDNRDGQGYTIQRLEDGNCWMMDNLNLGASDISVELNSENTNIAEDQTIEASTFNSWRKGGTNDNPAPMVYDQGAFVHLTTENTGDGLDADTTYGKNTEYGTLYNYYAASAGTISGTSNSDSAAYDLCPAGWRLPTSSRTLDSDFPNLVEYYDTNEKIRSPASTTNGGAALALSGEISSALDSSTPYLQGEYGYYWASSRYNNDQMYALEFNNISTDDVQPAAVGSRSYYYAMRCILAATGTILTENMQDFNTMTEQEIAEKVDAMEVGRNYVMKDVRDGQSYTVSKMLDGNVWMTKNLNLGAVPLLQNLTNENTNMNGNVADIDIDTFTGWKNTSTSSANWNSYNNNGRYKVLTGSDTTSGTVSGAPYGTLYNYYAASLGDYYFDHLTTIYGVDSDICPAGWRLPLTSPNGSSDETKNEFANLAAAYGNDTTLLHAPIAKGGAAFVFSGYAGNSVTSIGTTGRYWSATPYIYYYAENSRYSEDAYNFELKDSEYKTKNSSFISHGAAVRCILKTKRITDVHTLQEFKTLKNDISREYDVINSMTNQTNYTLKDNRDNQSYTIAKLNSYDIWMTQDLRLGSENMVSVLDSSNTNINQDGYTLYRTKFTSWRKADEYWETGLTNGVFMPSKSVASTRLYNYCVASAETVCIEENSNDATSDICPAGWRLPGGVRKSEAEVVYALGSEGNRITSYSDVSPYDAVSAGGAGINQAGYFSTTEINTSGSVYYWTKNNSNKSYQAAIYYNNNSYPGQISTAIRSNGLPVRCVINLD